MSLIQRLSPITSRLAHTLSAGRTARSLAARSDIQLAPLGLYFGGSSRDIYQITQWLAVFEQLNGNFQTVIFVKDAVAARAIASKTFLPVRLAGSADTIEPLTLRWGTRLMFYVNNNLSNFSVLRITHLTHIHLSHGESEKASMASNQLKAYDYCAVAGPASERRIMSALMNFDPAHLVTIGRPQLDGLFTTDAFAPTSGQRSILYAPTWEGDRSAMAYGSVGTAGERWVTEILADDRYRLIYRPHPKTGSRSKSVREAHKRIQKLVTAANERTTGARHIVDMQSDYHQALVSADAAIFDVSAMAMDFSVLQRPMLVSCPRDLAPSLAESPLWNVARRLDPSSASSITTHLDEALSGSPLANSVEFITDHFGNTAPGRSISLFTQFVRDLV